MKLGAKARVGAHVGGERVHAGVFEPGDRWYLTDDVLRRDVDGDYWYIDKLDNLLATDGGMVAMLRIEDALYRAPGVRRAVGYTMSIDGVEGPVAAIRAPSLDIPRLSEVLQRELLPHERPRLVFVVAAIPLNTGFRPMKGRLRAGGMAPAGLERILRYNAGTETYT